MKPNDLSQLRDLTKQIKLATTKKKNKGIPKDIGSYPNGSSIVAVTYFHEKKKKKGNIKM